MISHIPILLTSRSGLPTIEVGGTPYHSPYDPEREAHKFCSSLRIEDADVVFLFGWGLGYCGQILRARAKRNSKIIVFEPSGTLFDLSREREQTREALADPRFKFVVGDKLRRFFDEWGLQGCQETDQFLWIEWPPAAALAGDVLQSLKSRFKTRLRDLAGNLLTHFEKGSLYFENALANFNQQSSADVGRLFGRFKNVPMVIVSAGPSLDLNIHHLRGAEERCFILAVDTALRPLRAAGVTPHAVITADPGELNARHVAGAVPPSVFMIAEQGVQPLALESARERFLFGLGLFPDSLFAKYGFGKSALDVWGSVSTGALDLACRVGANPVIFVGQDFAFSRGREYASHTIFHNNPFSPELGGPVEERDIFGKPVRTTENLIAYRDFFVRKMTARHDIWFINSSEGGILRESVELLPLKEALNRSCNKPVDVTGRLAESCLQENPSLDALRHLVHALQTRSEKCACLGSFLELTAKREVLHKDTAAIDEKIRWGIEMTERVLKGNSQ